MGNRQKTSKPKRVKSQLAKMLAMVLLAMSGTMGHSQIPTGFWQAKSDKIGDGYLEGYQFGDSLSFEYRVNEYDTLNPLRGFGGRYKVLGDSIEFQIEYYEVLEDFSIILDYPGAGDWIWSALSRSIKKKSFPSAKIVAMKFRHSQDTIWINGFDFHLVNENWWKEMWESSD